jgi:hypothetical protein
MNSCCVSPSPCDGTPDGEHQAANNTAVSGLFLFKGEKEMTEADKKVLELRKKQNTCKAMAVAAKKRKDYLLQKFYENAVKGYEKKIFREQFVQ